MSQETIKTQLDKINLLFNVFMKEGLVKISPLEKDLLKEQVQILLKQIENLPTNSKSKIPSVIPTDKQEAPKLEMEKLKQDPIEEVVNEKIQEEVTEVPVIKEMPKIQFLTDEVEEVKLLKEEPLDRATEEAREFSSNKPVRSMKELIDLNKSFVLKAELFDNNHEKYIQYIEELNKIQNDEDSVRFVEKSAEQNNWNKEEKAYQLLQKAVEKRFLPYLQQ